MSKDEQELLDGYRAAGMEQREDMLGMARRALRNKPRSRLQLIACDEPREAASTIKRPMLKIV